jgi:putative hydrolase of the HAD superfamily
MRFKALFFDLDETLYPATNGLWKAIRERIHAYMLERMEFPPENIQALREKYFREYGTTLRGLQINHSVDMEEYLAFVHDVPLDQYLQPDPEQRRLIESLPVKKYIFTNADCAHANRVLQSLDLQGCFDGILDVHTIAPYCKPMPESFDLALQTIGSPEPSTCVLLDDQPRITRVARALGWYTILVGKDTAYEDADTALVQWADLPALLNGQI